MLDLGSYLLGLAQLLALAGFAWLGAASLRRRMVPELAGPAAGLAELVLVLALLVLIAEALGTFSLFEPPAHLAAMAAAGLGLRALFSGPSLRLPLRRPGFDAATVVALLLGGLVLSGVAGDVRLRLDTGMTGFDTTWYHAPFAAGFFQGGDTWSLHHIAPQFLAWFYPANGEVFHAIGMNAFGRDLASPLLNVGWLPGCAWAAWCIGRPFGVPNVSGLFAVVVLSVPAFADQAGEARNDVVGVFFLLAAVAIAISAASDGRASAAPGEADAARPVAAGALVLVGLSAGLAAGTKLNFLLPCAVLVFGLATVAPAGRRLSGFGLASAGALVGGGYWYLRNLAHTGNPLPWFDSLGPLALPAPDQELGGREAHSVLDYVADGAAWADWFLPGLHEGFGAFWPLLVALGLAGLLLGLGSRSAPVLRVAALAGLATVLAWLVAPTSASGPQGSPQGFESGLRYLVGGLALGAAMIATASPLRRLFRWDPKWDRRWEPPVPAWAGAAGLLALALLAAGAGYVAQREYLRDRYANPAFSAPGLDAAFKWATPLSDARIATTSTRQYPLFGTELSNTVEFVGEERPHGGFVAPASCRAWRRLLAAGDYDYVVASRDRVEAGKPAYPISARWTEGPGATPVLREPPTVVFRLDGPLPPAACG